MRKLARIFNSSFRSSIPAGHMRETIFIDLSARVIKGCELRGVGDSAIGHRAWSWLVAGVGRGRHPGIIILVFRGTLSAASRGTTITTAGA